MKILLINPKSSYYVTPFPEFAERLYQALRFFLPFLPPFKLYLKPYSLIAVAEEICRYGDEVKIVEENAGEKIKLKNVEVVGFTALTHTYPRVLQVARRLKKQKPELIIMVGGSHVTTAETIAGLGQEIDFVVQGEFEGMWPQIRQDILSKNYQRTYRRTAPYELENWHPYELPDNVINDSLYLGVGIIETTRGCIWDCFFCGANKIRENVGRFSLTSVAEQIKLVIRKGMSSIFITDNDFVVNPRAPGELSRVRELLNLMKSYHLPWIAQVDLKAFKYNADLIKETAESGCAALLVGIESLNEETLHFLKKSISAPEIKEVVADIHTARVEIIGCVILGIDALYGYLKGFLTEAEAAAMVKGEANRIRKFFAETQMAIPQVTAITPFLGTQLSLWLKNAHCDLSDNLTQYTATHVVFKTPENKLSRAIYREIKKARARIYSYPSILRRSYWAWRRCSNKYSYQGLIKFIWIFHTNVTYRKLAYAK